jgi:hypothetical protein
MGSKSVYVCELQDLVSFACYIAAKKNLLIIHIKLLTVGWFYARVLEQTRSTSFTAYREKIEKTSVVRRE